MRDDDLPCPTRRHGNAGDIYDFNDDILSSDVHAARRTLVRDESGVAAPVTVRDATAERVDKQLALLLVEPLRRDERDTDADIVEPYTELLRVPRNVRKRRRI